jgi:hypothetical protein
LNGWLKLQMEQASPDSPTKLDAVGQLLRWLVARSEERV